jgi:hypothetical protein
MIEVKDDRTIAYLYFDMRPAPKDKAEMVKIVYKDGRVEFGVIDRQPQDNKK